LSNIPTAHFGAAAKDTVDWRKETDEDPDDTELDETPSDIVKMLGFDPAKEGKPKTVADALARIDATCSRADAEWKESDHPRAKDGKFGSGGGGAKSSKEKAKKPKKSSPTDKMLKNKTSGEEKKWHQETKAWDDAPAIITDAIANTKGLSGVSNKSDTSSYYHPYYKNINMRQELDPNSVRSVLTWRHEYGHAMDFNGSEKPQSLACKAQMEYDVSTTEKIGRISWEYEDAMWEGYKDRQEAYHGEEGLFLSDFVAALTSNEYGYGHSKEYFSTAENRLCEMFANYVTLVSGNKGDKYYRILHKMAPSTCLAFEGILRSMGDKKRFGTPK